MLKLLALGVLGYAAYRYIQTQTADRDRQRWSVDQTAVAGGPLSENATLQSNPDQPPAAESYIELAR